MSKLRLLILLLFASAAAFLTSWHLAAQSATRRDRSAAAADQNGVSERLARLVTDLNARKETNTLLQVTSLLAAKDTLKNTVDAGITLMLLRHLREGRTEAAIEILETRLDGSLMGLGSSSQEVGDSQLKALERAREYRAKHPRKFRSPEIESGVERAFELLEKR